MLYDLFQQTVYDIEPQLEYHRTPTFQEEYLALRNTAHISTRIPLGSLRPIIPYPTGRFFWGGAVPGTSCQATIAPSLRDISPQALTRLSILGPSGRMTGAKHIPGFGLGFSFYRARPEGAPVKEGRPRTKCRIDFFVTGKRVFHPPSRLGIFVLIGIQSGEWPSD